MNKRKKSFIIALIVVLFLISLTCLKYYSSNNKLKEGSTIIMVPVYGQSLALGEEAQLVTNLDSLGIVYKNIIVSVYLDEEFGYYSNTIFKQNIKKMFNRRTRMFETSAYGLGEYIASQWIRNHCQDSIISVFAEGQGNTSIDYLNTNSVPYHKLLDEIKNAYDVAYRKHCKLVIPAFCWLQGENDITHNNGKGYKQKLQHFRNVFERDVKSITLQRESVKCILYQSNCLSLSESKFNSLNYECPQIEVPQAQMELVRDDENFCASGPVYPYKVVREFVHIDGVSQKRLGYLEGISLQKVFSGQKSRGVTPSKFKVVGNNIFIDFNVESPPLKIDTNQVKLAKNYGFSVIDKANKDILKNVLIKGNRVVLLCTTTPKECKVRYGVNGDYWKSGNRYGPRGNLRDNQGDHNKCIIQNNQYRIDNWAYMFDIFL